MLAATGDHDLAWFIGKTVTVVKGLDDGFLEFGNASHRGVTGEALIDGPDSSFPNVLGGVEIALPYPEIHHINALGLKLIGLGIQGQGGRRRYLLNAPR